jgi:hypothetical protein
VYRYGQARKVNVTVHECSLEFQRMSAMQSHLIFVRHASLNGFLTSEFINGL